MLKSGKNPSGQDPLRSAVWLTWYPHRRTTSICARWSVPLEVVDFPGHKLRRVKQTWHTVKRILFARERIIIVQNPSLGSTMIATLLRKLKRFRLVVDAHNEGVEPFARQGRVIKWLTAFLLRSADLTIVTNEELAAVVTRHGGKAVVLPDPLPVLSAPDRLPGQRPGGQAVVFAVMTYAADEPVDEILAAACMIKNDARFVLSGRAPERIRKRASELGDPVDFSGFLPETDYVRFLREADCVIDLSKMENCLVCGAYEAIAAGTPAVLSASPAARRLFGSAVELVENTPEAIAAAVCRVLENVDSRRQRVAQAALSFQDRWDSYSAEARSAVMG